MIQQFINWFEAKTRVYLYPRFVLFTGLLFGTIILYAIVFFVARSYTERVQPTGPLNEKEELEYQARMQMARPPVSVPSR